MIALLAVLLAPPAGADEPVQASATLHLRTTVAGNLPDPVVRYDVAAQDFALREYLGPRPSEAYPSAYASLALDASDNARISYSVARTGRVELGIYDVAGKLVRTLVDGQVSAGEQSVTWNRLDNGQRWKARNGCCDDQPNCLSSSAAGVCQAHEH